MSRIPPPRRPRPKQAKAAPSSANPGSLKIRLSGRDDAPLSIEELKDTLYEAVRLLLPYTKTHRIKRAALYLTTIDQHGTASPLMLEQTLTLRPYDCAAQTFDAPKR